MKRRTSGFSPILSTVILASSLLVIMTVASYAANNQVNFQVQTAHFNQAKNIMISLTQVVNKIMYTSHSSGYVTADFQNTLPRFAKNSDMLDLTITDGVKTRIYHISTEAVEIQGGNHVVVSTPKDLVGDDSILMTNASGSLARVRTYEADSGRVSMDYARIRCVFIGETEYFVEGEYQRFNVIQITLVNLTFGEYSPSGMTKISAQSLGIESPPSMEISNPSALRITASLSGYDTASCTLADLGGNPANKVLVNLVIVPVEVSMHSAGG
jgi:archaellum component FlaF (FlaF/FlaG flagellin family)